MVRGAADRGAHDGHRLVPAVLGAGALAWPVVLGALSGNPDTLQRFATYMDRLNRLKSILDRDVHEDKIAGAGKTVEVVRLARSLADAVKTDSLARQYYGQPPLREVILLPDGAQAPARRYLDWHRERIFHQ